MKSNESTLAKAVNKERRLFGNPSRQLFLTLLKRVRLGNLLLVEEDGTEHNFGEPRHQTSVHATIVVRDPAAYGLVLGAGSLGAGEAFMKGLWESTDLLQTIRLIVLNMDVLRNMDQSGSLAGRLTGRMFHLLHRNTLHGARDNIAAHYDLSNDFFKLFLDPTMALFGHFLTKIDAGALVSHLENDQMVESWGQVGRVPAGRVLAIGQKDGRSGPRSRLVRC